MAKQRASVQKREREFKKRDRERKKREKAEEKRMKRHGEAKDGPEDSPPGIGEQPNTSA